MLLTVRDAPRNDRLTSIFYGLSADAVAPLMRLLLYYGWESYVVFKNGRPITKGMFPATGSPLTWEPRGTNSDR